MKTIEAGGNCSSEKLTWVLKHALLVVDYTVDNIGYLYSAHIHLARVCSRRPNKIIL